MPKAVLCLLSALQFHEIGTQLPHEVWIALPEGTQTPALSYPTLRITRLRGTAYSDGIETVTDHGASIRVYSAAKTVTDCHGPMISDTEKRRQPPQRSRPHDDTRNPKDQKAL